MKISFQIINWYFIIIILSRRKILESSIEIRELESKLKTAYMVKERKKQIEERKCAEMKEKVKLKQFGAVT